MTSRDSYGVEVGSGEWWQPRSGPGIESLSDRLCQIAARRMYERSIRIRAEPSTEMAEPKRPNTLPRPRRVEPSLQLIALLSHSC